jgi:hydrogenase maturation protease
MNPLLVIGLGNPLMGDDGIGWHVAEGLAADPRLPGDAEVIYGGTDLLRCAAQIEGRRRVVLVDAVQNDAPPGTVSVIGEDAADLYQGHAHHLSAGQAMRLIRLTTPVCFTLLGVSAPSARIASELSPALSASMPAILDRVIEELR